MFSLFNFFNCCSTQELAPERSLHFSSKPATAAKLSSPCINEKLAQKRLTTGPDLETHSEHDSLEDFLTTEAHVESQMEQASCATARLEYLLK